MSGYTKTYRSVFNHDLFAGDEFSRREAWLWIISQAAWKPHRFRHRKKMIDIARGELPGARRHLAEAWGWGEQRVRTFLDELVVEGMINLSSNQQLTIISVCNYGDFQDDAKTSNQQLTSSQPAANHTEEGKELKEYKKYDTREAASDDPFGFRQTGDVIRCPNTGALSLINGLHARWLQTFKTEERLALALEQASGFIQINGTRPLEAQVSSQLARIASEKLDRDSRYQAAASSKAPKIPAKITGRHISKDGRLLV